MAKKRGNSFIRVLLFIIKTPYYLFRGVQSFTQGFRDEKGKAEVANKRKAISSKYEEFKTIETVKGNYSNWLNKIFKSDSQIGIILGARGSGKTAFGVKFLENFHTKYKKKCFAIGFDEKELPSWINVISDTSQIENNSLVLIDEGGVLFNSRNSMRGANKLLSQLILISRHKNISILFISQNSSNLEVNILRQADFLVLKPSSLLQKDFERKIIQRIYESTERDFEKFKKQKGITYIHSDEFRGFVTNPLPSFWKEEISKSFK